MSSSVKFFGLLTMIRKPAGKLLLGTGTRLRLMSIAADNIAAFLRGTPKNVVN